MCACRCAGARHVSVHIQLAGEHERLMGYAHGEGNADGRGRYFSATRETCGRVASALGFAGDEMGYALRTILLAADVGGCGGDQWVCVERLAKNPGEAWFHTLGVFTDGVWTEEMEEDARKVGGEACRTFPFDVALEEPIYGRHLRNSTRGVGR